MSPVIKVPHGLSSPPRTTNNAIIPVSTDLDISSRSFITIRHTEFPTLDSLEVIKRDHCISSAQPRTAVAVSSAVTTLSGGDKGLETHCKLIS